MWWPVVFWLLLIPLLIVETIIFLKTKRFFWLIYAVSIFTYVVSVSYTLDVFDASRNAIIITLVASAILMALIGRHLGKNVKKRKTFSTKTRNLAIGLLVIIILIFTLSIIFGRVSETVTPAESIALSTIIQPDAKELGRFDDTSITILTRHIENDFFLPVPVVRKEYRICLETPDGLRNLYDRSVYVDEEVPAGESIDVDVHVGPHYADLTATNVFVYEGKDQYETCTDIQDEPTYTIPVV